MYGVHVSEDALVYLITQTMSAVPERALAAKFLLDCIRHGHDRDDIVECIEGLELGAILDVASDARELAANVGLRLSE